MTYRQEKQYLSQLNGFRFMLSISIIVNTVLITYLFTAGI